MKQAFDKLLNGFWYRNLLVVAVLCAMTFLFTPDKGIENHIRSCIWTLLLYVWVVIHNRVLIEKALIRKKYLLYGAGLLVGLFYFRFVMILFTQKGTAHTLFSDVSTAIFNTIVGTIIYFAFRYVTEQNSLLRNRLLLQEMEQKYLVSQLSPHFLFNTLNNIYSDSINDARKTPELILKLSELLRYLIGLNKRDRISLGEEIRFIEDYILFEEQRLSDRCTVTVEVNILNPAMRIEPLLFFPLIENAFKHGTNTMRDCFVSLRIDQKDSLLVVHIENLLLGGPREVHAHGNGKCEKAPGVGLSGNA
ncbi:MAG: sensor histidine kinase [Bacteroidota bacterium]